MATFFATLTPMLTLFLCIAVGFVLKRTNIFPDNAGSTMAKMETWIFGPCISFVTMMRFCNFSNLYTHATNIVMMAISVGVALAISYALVGFFTKKDDSDRGIYSYSLTFTNYSYMGDPLVLALFGEETFAYYKLAVLPLTIVVFVWGINILIPQKQEKKRSILGYLYTAPTVALFIGIFFGLTGFGKYLPAFVISALDSLKACMGPVAMLLAGFTVAKYDILGMLKSKKVYAFTLLRLIVIPVIIIAALFGIKKLVDILFAFKISNDILFLCFFATAGPVGLNAIVYPESYGGNSQAGAALTLVTHTLCIITIPVLYAIMVALFGTPFGA